jgi:hypothetical protein
MAEDKGDRGAQSGGVSIGDVSGGIQGAIIAGRDVVGSTASYATIPAEEPTAEKLEELLVQIQKALAEVMSQQEALQQIDPTAHVQAQLAEAQIKTATDAVQAADELRPEDAKSVQSRLEQASGLLNGILEAAKSTAEKTIEVGKAVKPIAEALKPVLESLAVAGAWVAKLWLAG